MSTKRPQAEYLQGKNPHSRDADISFMPYGHKYAVKGESNYISVTKWVNSQFPVFNAEHVINRMMASPNWANSSYHGRSKQSIKDEWQANGKSAAAAGTRLHEIIERFYNNCDVEVDEDMVEFQQFLEFEEAIGSKLRPFRTEWRVFDESLKVAGTIDMAFEGEARDAVVLYDWKRSKKIVKDNCWQNALSPGLSHLPDANYWKYALQLNAYRHILEKCYGKTVEAMFVVVLHPLNANKSFIRLPIPVLERELRAMRKERVPPTCTCSPGTAEAPASRVSGPLVRSELQGYS